MAKHDIGLVVIDSVGGIFRTETTDFHARSIEMRRFGAALVALSKKYSPCAVICVNQVTPNNQPKLHKQYKILCLVRSPQ